MQSGRPWLAEAVRRPGARLIWASTGGLAVLALATFYVSFHAQFTFMYAVKHQDLPALIEALIADVAMVTCSLLALGIAAPGASPLGADAYPLNGGDRMIKTGYPRPCPIPGHPQDQDEPVLVTESAWSRLRAWHLRAPAERLPLPVILTAWPSAWILHAAHVPGHVVTYATVPAPWRAG